MDAIDQILEDLIHTIDNMNVIPFKISIRETINKNREVIEKWLKRNRKNLLKYLKQ